jgi:hypothetical protein
MIRHIPALTTPFVVASLLVAAAVMAPQIGHAAALGPTPYLCFDRNAITGCGSADSPYAAVLAGGNYSYFHLETFEDGLFNVPGVTKTSPPFISDNSSVLGPTTITDSVDADIRIANDNVNTPGDGLGTINGLGTDGTSLSSSLGSSGIGFTFNSVVLGALPTDVGIVWTDGGTSATVEFEAFDANGGSLGIILSGVIGSGGNSGQTDEDHFFGFTHAGGIARFDIRNATGSGGIEVDHLQYGVRVVPVPAAIWLFGSAILSLAARTRSRRRQAPANH